MRRGTGDHTDSESLHRTHSWQLDKNCFWLYRRWKILCLAEHLGKVQVSGIDFDRRKRARCKNTMEESGNASLLVIQTCAHDFASMKDCRRISLRTHTYLKLAFFFSINHKTSQTIIFDHRSIITSLTKK